MNRLTTLSFVFTLLFGFVIGVCEAGDFNFETTSEGIVDKLTADEAAPEAESGETGEWEDVMGSDAPPTRTRGVKTRGRKTRGVETRTIKVVRKEKGEEVWETIVAPEQRTGAFVNMKVEFDVNSYQIRPGSIPLLDALGQALADPRLAGRTIHINGHTDSDGRETYNLRLSMNRALSVKQYLTANHQVYSERLKAIGLGEGMPLAPNTTTANKQLNRRVEIVAVEQ